MAETIDQASFEDVLKITADAGAFAESLKAIEAAYDAFVARLGEKSSEVIGTGSVAAIAAMVSDLQQLIQVFVDQSSIAYETMGETMQAVLSKVQTAQAEANEEAIAGLKEQTTYIDGLTRAELQNMEAKRKNAQLSGGLPTFDDKNAALNDSINYATNLTEVPNQSKAQETTAYKDLNALLAEQNKLIDDNVAATQRQVDLAHTLDTDQDGIAIKQAERDAAQATRQRTLAEEIVAEQDAIVAAHEAAIAKEEAADNARFASLTEKIEAAQLKMKSLDESFALNNLKGNWQAQIDLLDQRLAEAKIQVSSLSSAAVGSAPVAGDAGAAESQLASINALNAAKQAELGITNQLATAHAGLKREIDQASNSSESMFNKFFGSIGDSFISLGKFIAVWGVLQLAIEAVTEIISAPFRALQEGMQFVTEVEEQSAIIASSMASNVIYSSDFATNFQKVSQVSNQVAIALQQIAAQTGLSAQNLTKVYEALANSGAGETVKNAQDLVNLTQMFTLALEASGRTGTNIRNLISQLPQLFEGTLKNSSALAESLGMSGAQLKSLVADAKTHKDLVEQLTPLLQGQVDEAKTLENTHGSLVARVTEWKKLLEGIAALPIMGTFDDLLKQALTYLDQNKDKLVALALATGEWIQITVLGFKNLAALGSPVTTLALDWLQAFSGVASVIDHLIFGMKSLDAGKKIASGTLTGLVEGSAEEKQAWDQLGKNNEARDAAIKKIEDIAKSQNTSQLASAIGSYDKDIAALMTQLNGKNLSDPFAGTKPKPTQDTTKAAHIRPAPKEHDEDKALYQADLENIKSYYDTRTEIIKQGEAAGAINAQQAADQLATMYAEEKVVRQRALDDRIDDINKEEQANLSYLTSNASAKKPVYAEDIDNITTKAQKLRDEATTAFNQVQDAINKSQATADNAATKEPLDVDAAKVRAEEQLSAAQEKADIADINTRKAQGYITERQALAETRAIEQKEHQDRLADLIVETANYAEGSVKRTEADAKVALEQQSYANKKRSDDQADLAAALRAADVLSANQTQQTLSHLSTLKTSAQLIFDVNPVKVFSQTSFDITDAEVAAKVKRLQFQINQNLSAGKGNDEDVMAPLRQSLADANNQAFSSTQSRIQSIGSNQPAGVAGIEMEAALQAAMARLQAQGPAKDSVGGGSSPQAVQQFNDQMNGFITALQQLNPKFSDALTNFVNKLAGFDVEKAFRDAKGPTKTVVTNALTPEQEAAQESNEEAGVDADTDAGDNTKQVSTQSAAVTATKEFTVGITAAAQATKDFSTILSAIKQGEAQGGTLGGIGAGLSSAGGMVGSLASVFGKVAGQAGAIGAAIGGIVSFVGALFQQHAQEIAQNVQNSVQTIMTNYQNQSVNLVTTIGDLQAQQQEAIANLSGVKGGQSQLDKILPQLQQQIQQLQQQAEQLMTTFDAAVGGLVLGQTLGGIQQQWVAINKQVTDYVNAGGSAANATYFLSASLQQMQETAQTQLDQANSQALQDAITLNGLLQQKVDLQTNYNAQVFSLKNADSLERMQAGVVTRGQQIAQATTDYNTQLDNLNSQIDLETQRVTLEGQVFDISTDLATNQQAQNQLNIDALTTQIGQWNDLKTIINSINKNPDGTYSGTGLLSQPASTTTTIGQIVVNVTTAEDGTTQGQVIADSITQAIQQNSRQGIQ